MEGRPLPDPPWSAEALRLLSCPRCAAALSPALLCAECGAQYRAPGGIPDLRLPSDARTERVRGFYAESPFPGYYPPHDSLERLRARASRSEFARLLDAAIPGDARILEMGCGTGQMSLFLATADRLVIGADLSRTSLELAEDARRRYGIDRAAFVETDLRACGLQARSFDVVYSSGVLHHTPDPRASFASLARLARPRGVLLVGLYSAYGRLPHRLRRAVARVSGFRLVPFDPVLRDRSGEPARRAAWLRDQYQHPEEHRHTLAEARRWFAENDVDYLRCYPDAVLAAETLRGGALFSPAQDQWALEEFFAQLGWIAKLAAEGGLFVAIGRVRG